jgi:hypothetical protein
MRITGAVDDGDCAICGTSTRQHRHERAGEVLALPSSAFVTQTAETDHDVSYHSGSTRMGSDGLVTLPSGHTYHAACLSKVASQCTVALDGVAAESPASAAIGSRTAPSANVPEGRLAWPACVRPTWEDVHVVLALVLPPAIAFGTIGTLAVILVTTSCASS